MQLRSEHGDECADVRGRDVRREPPVRRVDDRRGRWSDPAYGFSVLRFDFRHPEARTAFRQFRSSGRPTKAVGVALVEEVANGDRNLGTVAPEGDWTVELSVTPAQMKRFSDLVVAGRVNKYSLIYAKKYADHLESELSSAKDGRAY